mgnify:CR=1 FL=1
MGDDWEMLKIGCRAFLEVALDPHVARILLIDAPAVLGWMTWRQIDEQNSMRLLREKLTTLRARGIIETASTDALAHLLSGAMNELALWIAGSAEPAHTLDEAAAALDGILERLRGAALHRARADLRGSQGVGAAID